jgi:XRE family transcriptional regulator, regulator of sulfur utilization
MFSGSKVMQDSRIVRKRIGNRIRFLRERKGWTQRQLAKESGLGRRYVGTLERGEAAASIESLRKLCDALEVSMTVLMEGVDDLNLAKPSVVLLNPVGASTSVATDDPGEVRKRAGDRLRLLRLQAGWSQFRFSQESGLGRVYEGKLESGQPVMGLEAMCKITGTLGITFSELLQGVYDVPKRRPSVGRQGKNGGE